jgi:hypothetical protein
MEEGIDQLRNLAAGEALFGSFVLTALVTLLVQKGLLLKPEVVALIDSVLLVFEQNQMGAPPAVVDHARRRLEVLLSHFAPDQQSERLPPCAVGLSRCIDPYHGLSIARMARLHRPGLPTIFVTGYHKLAGLIDPRWGRYF